jgi:gliding motility-associated-like protein
MNRYLLLVFLFLISSAANLLASDYYWVGGSGDWSDINHWVTTSGGTTNHIQTPTSNDNVIFDANSFSANSVVNLNIATIFCKTFNAEQITHNVNLSGICNLWKVYGGFKLSKKLIINGADIYFEAPSGNFNLAFKNNNLSNNLFFKGNATWVLLDTLNCSDVNLESGTFIVSSRHISIGNFTSNTTNSRQLLMSNSHVVVGNWEVNGNGYSVDANNSVIVVNGVRFRHITNGNISYNDVNLMNYCSVSNTQQNLVFRKLQFYKNGSISGSNTYDSLVFEKGYDYLIQASTNHIINMDLVAVGDCKKPIKIEGSNSFVTFTKNSGAIYCSYLVLKHIHATGGALFQAAATEDLGDNTGWSLTPPPPRTLYWVGGVGNWTDTIHWAYTSGGPGGECIPTIVDDVIIDSNSFPFVSTITVNTTAFCHDITWMPNVNGVLTSSNTLNISGSAFFGDSLYLTPAAFLKFISSDNGETITSSNIDFHGAMMLFEGTGSWTLQDSIKNSGGTVQLSKGHLLTNGKYVLANNFGATGGKFKKLSLVNSIIDVENVAKFQQDSLFIYPGTSHIRMIGGLTKFETVGINPDSLYNLSFVSDTGTATSIVNGTTFNKVSHMCDVLLTGISTSDTMYFKKGKSFIFDARIDSIHKALIANGSCSQVITMRENTAMGQFTFQMPSTATVDVSHISLRGAKGVGGANFIAINSSDLSNNTGWTFSNTSADHYWINGSGNWQDSTHWSYSSGGQGGACIPKIYDNVYFDGNSFVASNDSVIADTNNIFCKDMSWVGALNNPIFYFDSSDYVHFISGSMTLISDMDFQNKNKTYFVWDQLNKTINMSGQSFKNDIIFADSGQWTLLDTLVAKSNIFHHIGALITNTNPVFAESYFGDLNKVKTLDIHDNTFHITKNGNSQMFSWVKSNQTNIITTNSEIIFDNGGFLKTSGNGQIVFHNVSFMDSLADGIVRHNSSVSNKFNKLFFKGDGRIESNNYMDTLIFSRSSKYLLEGGMHQYITNSWQANTDCYGFIEVRGDVLSSASTSVTANVHMLNGNVNLAGVKLGNINGIGNGSFSVVNGFDLGGNSSNWQISTYPARTLYWVNNAGSWWDTAHWSLSSGGISGECIPTYIDDVHFTDLSFNSSSDTAYSPITPIECHSMYWNYTPDTPYMDITKLNIYGSLWLGDTMEMNNVASLYLHARDSGNVIRSASKRFVNTYFKNQGEWTLIDDFSSGMIFHDMGTFVADGNSISTDEYRSKSNLTTPPIRELNISNSSLNVKYKVDLLTDNFNLIANNSDIVFDNALSTSPNFKLYLEGNDVLNFGRVTFEPSMVGLSKIRNLSSSIHNFEKVTINNSADIFGEHNFDSLIFHAGNTYQLENGKTQTIGDYWFVRGNNCFALILQSTLKGQQAYASKLSGNVNGDFINMRDIHAIGGASFFAGDFSTDISNNSGWTFSNGPQYVYGLGPNVNLNLGSSVTLSSANFNGGPNTTYLWSTGSTAPNITVNQTGWYYITVNYAGACIVYDSIWVGCNLSMNYNVTDNPCFGDSLGIILPIPPDTSYVYSYHWSNNTDSSVANNLSAGIYTVTVSADSGYCLLYDTLQITEPPEIFCSQNDTAFCIGDSVMLDLGGFVNFDWNDGYSNQYRWVSQKDSFVVRVQDADGCWSLPDSIHIRQDLPPFILLPDDTTICQGGSVLLDAGDGFDSYLWSNNSAMSSITVYNIGMYWVIVSEKTCKSTDTIEIFNCPAKFIVPNVFTPNGDGYNDYFDIEYQNIWKFEIKIYNRWGTKIYSSNNLEDPWDGKIKGQPATEGVYFWEIIYQEYNGQGGGNPDKKIKGTLSLYR